jgi:hypothetical protein
MEGEQLKTSLNVTRLKVKRNLRSLRVVLEEAAPVDAYPARVQGGSWTRLTRMPLKKCRLNEGRWQDRLNAEPTGETEAQN